MPARVSTGDRDAVLQDRYGGARHTCYTAFAITDAMLCYLYIRPFYRSSRRHYVFGLSVRLCVCVCGVCVRADTFSTGLGLMRSPDRLAVMRGRREGEGKGWK